VVLGHGLGTVKEMRLDAYAERSAAAGYVCLVFDYPHFGSSGGEPRQLLDIKRQLDDWRAAVRFVRALEAVDADRVADFGSSFGGGQSPQAEATLRHAARAPRGETIHYPVGHFEIYRGEPFERAVADQLAFLRRHLPV
jgi:fermentation-respiration switch protein FrsA (DUF1100 family)